MNRPPLRSGLCYERPSQQSRDSQGATGVSKSVEPAHERLAIQVIGE
jgi:hypothetical protein